MVGMFGAMEHSQIGLMEGDMVFDAFQTMGTEGMLGLEAIVWRECSMPWGRIILVRFPG
ncbi:MAG: hypothetical protein CM1200mP22_16280 [Dehalococcoidia bacterium]|nr:MAG: hypothetical protein CM1200mP22_16280 [Dehalococcoidia bacterium]